MATIRAYTTIEQSRKLAEILPLESADMYYFDDNGKEPKFKVRNGITYYYDSEDCLCCWSLAALRNLLPPAIKSNKNTYLFESHNTFDKSWVYRYYNEDDASHLYCKNISEVDACVEMIIKLNELKML